jgi:hypothetical protein
VTQIEIDDAERKIQIVIANLRILNSSAIKDNYILKQIEKEEKLLEEYNDKYPELFL